MVGLAFIAWEGGGDRAHAQGGMALGGEVDGGANSVLCKGKLAAGWRHGRGCVSLAWVRELARVAMAMAEHRASGVGSAVCGTGEGTGWAASAWAINGVER